jgi:hypothetical protein
VSWAYSLRTHLQMEERVMSDPIPLNDGKNVNRIRASYFLSGDQRPSSLRRVAASGGSIASCLTRRVEAFPVAMAGIVGERPRQGDKRDRGVDQRAA